MCITDCYDLTLGVEVELNFDTIIQSVGRIDNCYTPTNEVLGHILESPSPSVRACFTKSCPGHNFKCSKLVTSNFTQKYVTLRGSDKNQYKLVTSNFT